MQIGYLLSVSGRLVVLGCWKCCSYFYPTALHETVYRCLFMGHVFFSSSFFAVNVVAVVLGCWKCCSCFYPAALHETVYRLPFHDTRALPEQLFLYHSSSWHSILSDFSSDTYSSRAAYSLESHIWADQVKNIQLLISCLCIILFISKIITYLWLIPLTNYTSIEINIISTEFRILRFRSF